ncbi:hypothetical protein EDD63_1012 [Breznakia blatticola]|uniref:GGDEF domain-containing protein n=1 Tax=Breznakia blatticola TaxID=1754012 RepID=A0A4R8A737_9FIRM|nr:hypothetical protein [Breznakia blatticola]TDW26289.1 hypothetical protein EDD63_1012 [Breznakia blatticola]
MKYPVLEMDRVPHGFKSSELSYIVSFDFDDVNNFANDDLHKKYLSYIQREVHGLVENMHVMYRPEVVKINGQYFVLLKDNMDMYKITETVKKILGEIDRYTEGKVDVKAHVLMAMLLQKGKDVSFFKTKKVGDPILESAEYMNSVISEKKDFDSSELSYVTPWEEFVMLDEKRNQEAKEK